MEVKKRKFEKELVAKIQQKLKGRETEESFLIKAFKFMDIYGCGKVNFEQFSGGIGRMGFVLEKAEMQEIFDAYDFNKDKMIDYKEFCGVVLGKTSAPVGHTAAVQKDTRGEILLDILKKKLNERGAKGIMGLLRAFNIVDKDKSGTLSVDELKQAFKDYKLNIDAGDIEIIFKELDKDHDSSISQNEFLRTIRGEMSEPRLKVVLVAFNMLDSNHNGVIEIPELMKKYSGAKHPAVIQGRKTEKQIIEEFASTFELYAEAYGKGVKDSNVTKEEFVEYYTNISASIDSDEYFLEMMKACWKITQEQLDAPIKAPVYHEEPIIEQAAPRVMSPHSSEHSEPAPVFQPEEEVKLVTATEVEEPQVPSVLLKFRKAVLSRQVRGMLGIERQFKVYTRKGFLELEDFKQAIENFRLHIEYQELQ